MDLILSFIQTHQTLLIIGSIAMMSGILIGVLLRNGKVRAQQSQIKELMLKLDWEQQHKAELDEILDHTRDQLANTFNQLSNEALNRNNTNFLRLAEENLKRFQSEAKAELGNKEKAIEQLLKPINEALQNTSKQIHEIEKERKEAYGSLNTT
ncbi:MAG: DNA recombination protein RmuC, partial [Methylophaga sp.]